MKKKVFSFLLLVLTLLITVSPLYAQERERPMVALVLSGGGARGFAHVPVIAELERRGITPDLVVGTSMGGLIGGLYAAGYTAEEMYTFILNTDFSDVVFNINQEDSPLPSKAYNNFYDRSLSIGISEQGLGSRDSFLDDSHVNLLLHQAVAKAEAFDDFDKLPIPFRTVGTDYKTGEGIIFSSGSFYEALRATMSMPVIFPSVVLDDGTYVVDGGMYNNMPVDLARSMGADIIIAVDVNESVLEYTDESGAMNTLSGSFEQYLLIGGQINTSRQYADADYLLLPDTGGFSVIAFDSTEGILAAGEKYVEENQELFDRLEAELSDYLPLERDVMYSELDYPVINSFSFEEKLERFAPYFHRFEGREYNEETIAEIDRQLNKIKEIVNLLSVNYKYVDGVIHVTSRDYAGTTGALSLGLTGGFHAYAHFSDNVWKGVFNPDLSLSLDFWFDSLCITPAVRIGQQNMLSLSLYYQMGSSSGLDASVHAGFGGFSAISDRNYVNRYPSRDWNAGAVLDLVLLRGRSQRFDLGLEYDFYYFGKIAGSIHTDIKQTRIWEDDYKNLAVLRASYHFDGRMLESISESGYDLRLSACVGFDGRMRYDILSDFSSVIRLADRASHFLFLDLSAFSSRMPQELLSSYRVDPFGRISNDYVWADVSYRYYPFAQGDGLYFGAGLFVEGLNGDDDVSPDGKLNTSMIPFSSIDSMEYGVSLESGYKTDFGDINVRIHISFTGKASLEIALM